MTGWIVFSPLHMRLISIMIIKNSLGKYNKYIVMKIINDKYSKCLEPDKSSSVAVA